MAFTPLLKKQKKTLESVIYARKPHAEMHTVDLRDVEKCVGRVMSRQWGNVQPAARLCEPQ